MQFMTGNFCVCTNEKELAEKPVASMPFLRTFSLNIFPMGALVTVYETVKLQSGLCLLILILIFYLRSINPIVNTISRI